MDERARRLWAGAEAGAIGYSGVVAVARATGMAISTVRKGRDEVRAGATLEDVVNVRRSAGPRPYDALNPEGWPKLERLVDPVTRGDPESPLRWTCKSTHTLSAEMLALYGISLCDRELRRLRPTVVHFRGHGMQRTGSAPPSDECSTLEGTKHNGMHFRGADGRAHFVSAAALRRTFSAVGRCVKLIVFNTCYDGMHAEATFPYADCVIGMQSSAQDGAARNFAIGFYGALGERESITTAYEQGCAAISLEGNDDHDRPRLWVRDGVDAGQIVLAAELRQHRARNRERATAARRADPVSGRRGQRSAAGPTMASGRTQRSKSSPVT